MRDLREAFEAERERVDAEFVRSDDFARLAEDVLDRVQTIRNEDKLGYWAALLAGVATHDRPAERDRERMIEALDSLRRPHLRLLHVIATTSEARPDLYMTGVSDTLKWKMPDVPQEEARRDWGDLARHAIVDYPSGDDDEAGRAGNLAGRLTLFGRQFVQILGLEAGYSAPVA